LGIRRTFKRRLSKSLDKNVQDFVQGDVDLNL